MTKELEDLLNEYAEERHKGSKIGQLVLQARIEEYLHKRFREEYDAGYADGLEAGAA